MEQSTNQVTSQEQGTGLSSKDVSRVRHESGQHESSVNASSEATLPITLEEFEAQRDFEAERAKRNDIENGLSFCRRAANGATINEQHAPAFALFDETDTRPQSAEFYSLDASEIRTYGHF